MGLVPGCAHPRADEQTLMWCQCQSRTFHPTASYCHSSCLSQQDTKPRGRDVACLGNPVTGGKACMEQADTTAAAYLLTDTSLNLCPFLWKLNAQVPGKWQVREDEGPSRDSFQNKV